MDMPALGEQFPASFAAMDKGDLMAKRKRIFNEVAAHKLGPAKNEQVHVSILTYD